MEIEFDSVKDAQNAAKHGIGLAFAILVLSDPYAISVTDDRRDYGEMRMRSLGSVDGRVYVVVHTERGERRRIISVRKSNERETEIYRNATAKS